MTLDPSGEHAQRPPIDLLVIGGGVNGAGIARDASGRGLSVVLCEQGDLAGATSSASSKLVHGGLRYLEQYEFRLVRESLKEREVLLRSAPHIIWPMRFVLPHHKGLRPVWMLRLGLLLYDHLGHRELLPGSRALNLSNNAAGAPLKECFTRGFEYSDCWVDDARLVVLNALDAHERGADVQTRTKFVSAQPDGPLWRIRVRPAAGEEIEFTARAIVNAAGPWVQNVLGRVSNTRRSNSASLRLVKGSHLVTRKLFEGEHAYIFQNADGRVLFAIPYEHDFTLLGTTDEPFEEDPATPAASSNEISYLLHMASDYFGRPVTEADIVHTYSGVRPLYDDASDKTASTVTRDYVLEINGGDDHPPLMSVYGGKITTYRKLAEHALEKLQPFLGFTAGSWTAATHLPGGDIPNADFDAFLTELRAAHPWLEARQAHRLGRAYGTRCYQILDGARAPADLGQKIEGGLTEREVAYLVANEWALTTEDVLWRRSKIGLHHDGVSTRLEAMLRPSS